jgi:hypothetical protein
MSMFVTEGCTGAPYFSYPYLYLGCAATTTQVTVSTCNVAESSTKLIPPQELAIVIEAQQNVVNAASKFAAGVKAKAIASMV